MPSSRPEAPHQSRPGKARNPPVEGLWAGHHQELARSLRTPRAQGRGGEQALPHSGRSRAGQSRPFPGVSSPPSKRANDSPGRAEAILARAVDDGGSWQSQGHRSIRLPAQFSLEQKQETSSWAAAARAPRSRWRPPENWRGCFRAQLSRQAPELGPRPRPQTKQHAWVSWPSRAGAVLPMVSPDESPAVTRSTPGGTRQDSPLSPTKASAALEPSRSCTCAGANEMVVAPRRASRSGLLGQRREPTRSPHRSFCQRTVLRLPSPRDHLTTGKPRISGDPSRQTRKAGQSWVHPGRDYPLLTQPAHRKLTSGWHPKWTKARQRERTTVSLIAVDHPQKRLEVTLRGASSRPSTRSFKRNLLEPRQVLVRMRQARAAPQTGPPGESVRRPSQAWATRREPAAQTGESSQKHTSTSPSTRSKPIATRARRFRSHGLALLSHSSPPATRLRGFDRRLAAS